MNNNPTTLKVLEMFQGFRMSPLPMDEFESKGKMILADKMDSFIQKNMPIEFAMLGFPFKSANTVHKVIGNKPDLAEEKTFLQFKRFGEAVKSVYNKGIILNVISDGLAFNNIWEIPDDVTREYHEINKDMSKDTPVKWFTLDDFYSGHDLTEKREKVVKQFGITEDELQHEILFNPDVNMLYRGIIKFSNEEKAFRNFPSNQQRQNAAKKMAKATMFMNEAYSNLVKKEFADKIRLSMHPSINNGAKYSFQLIPGDAKHSAWHCVLFVDEHGNLHTIHKKDAEANGYSLVHKDGRPYYYVNY